MAALTILYPRGTAWRAATVVVVLCANTASSASSGHLEPCATKGRLGWISDGQSCYFISAASPASETEHDCFGNGGNLASIHSDCETSFLSHAISSMGVLDTSFMQTCYLIGLRDIGIGSERAFKWTDQTRYDYQNWRPTEPNNWDGSEPCVELLTMGWWNDNRCERIGAHICKIKDDHTARENVKRCRAAGKEDWISDGSSCYFISTNELSLDDAQAVCKSHESNLLSLHGDTESQFAVMATANVGRRYSHWIGLRPDLSGVLQWLDGTVLDYEKWFSGQPNIDRLTCVEMFVSGFWSQCLCEDIKGYICKQVNASGIDATNAQRNRYHYGNFVYTFSNPDQSSTFKNAKTACSHLGAQLLSIHSQHEVEFLINMTLSLGVSDYRSLKKSYWIGLRQVRNGSYSWADDTPFDFQNWVTAPRNQTDKTCVEMLSIGNWNSASCTDRKPYICKSSDERGPASWLSSETTTMAIFIIGGAVIAVLSISWIVYGLVRCHSTRGRASSGKCMAGSATAAMPGYETLRLRRIPESAQTEQIPSECGYSYIVSEHGAEDKW